VGPFAYLRAPGKRTVPYLRAPSGPIGPHRRSAARWCAIARKSVGDSRDRETRNSGSRASLGSSATCSLAQFQQDRNNNPGSP